MLPWRCAGRTTQTRISFSKKLLFTQPEPILDILLQDSASEMLILGTDKLSLYRLTGDKWIASGAASLVLPRPCHAIREDGCNQQRTDCTYICRRRLAREPTTRASVDVCERNRALADAQVHWVADRNTLAGDAVKTPFFSQPTAYSRCRKATFWTAPVNPWPAPKVGEAISLRSSILVPTAWRSLPAAPIPTARKFARTKSRTAKPPRERALAIARTGNGALARESGAGADQGATLVVHNCKLESMRLPGWLWLALSSLTLQPR